VSPLIPKEDKKAHSSIIILTESDLQQNVIHLKTNAVWKDKNEIHRLEGLNKSNQKLKSV